METVWIVIFGIVALAVVGLVGMMIIWQDARGRLQPRVGPEYDRQVRTRGSKRHAKRHPSNAAARHDRFDIRPLEPAARERYLRRWEAVQTGFVDRPGPALDEADRLVMDVMHDRGYPVSDFTERLELVAVDYPEVVKHYHAAHAARQSHYGHPSPSDTEHLQQAFVHYRKLFEALVRDGKLGDRTAQQPPAQTPPPPPTRG